MSLTINVEEQDGVKIFRLAGFIDSETSERLKNAIEEALKTGAYRIIMDLGKVDYVSSAGWGLFVGYLHEARKNAGDIKIAAMKKEVLEIYELLDFANILQYFKDVEGARGAF
ncbi:MAG: STAS domain-containing protein [Spirochaetia bacterium]|nr:STAS domain-containing protein [Spirochaetia bacterium]